MFGLEILFIGFWLTIAGVTIHDDMHPYANGEITTNKILTIEKENLYIENWNADTYYLRNSSLNNTNLFHIKEAFIETERVTLKVQKVLGSSSLLVKSSGNQWFVVRGYPYSIPEQTNIDLDVLYFKSEMVTIAIDGNFRSFYVLNWIEEEDYKMYKYYLKKLEVS